MGETKKIWDYVRARFPEKEYALMEEVSNAAGFSRSRSADFMAVNLWPSRGLAIHGIELKSYRGDWLNELKNPAKQESHFKFCDHFWLLTSDESVAKIEEIPTNWGWMCIKGQRIVTQKEAPKLSPVEITRSFLCAMLKRAADKTSFVHVDSIEERIATEKEKSLLYKQQEVDRLSKDNAALNGIIQAFERSSGVSMNRWENPQKIGEAVKLINSGGVDTIKTELQQLQTTAEKIAKKVKNILTQLPELEPIQQ